MSYHTLSTKNTLNASVKTLLKRGAHLGLGIGAFTPVLALANPTGQQVVAGQATFHTPSANALVITQKSQSAIINWQQFDIGTGQYVQFVQPSSSSVVLNRVIGGSPTSILGSLNANGQVFLVNTNGVFFGKGATIDAQGFLASTLDITNQNFLAHDYLFDEAGAPGATVVNQGSITAHHSGYVVLAGNYAENDGIIMAQTGHVILAAGSKATLTLNGNSFVNFAVNQSTLASYVDGNIASGVKNTGSLLADGGTVIMTADVANALKATVVNNIGLVQAHAISNKGGSIYLTAAGGDIQNAGTLDVSADTKNQAGGDITLKGDGKTILTNTSQIDAMGDNAAGGRLEVSGSSIAVRGTANLGRGGNLLLDPTSVEIVAGSTAGGVAQGTSSGANANVGLAFIEKTLNSGANVLISAHKLIDASAGVTAITATGKGNLSFKVSQAGGNAGGQINLSDTDITIGGKLTASMGYGTFGHLTAGSINLVATGDIRLTRAKQTGGVVNTFSAKTTAGLLNITAAHVEAHSGGGGSSEDGLALSAKTGLDLEASIGTASGKFGSNVTLMGASVKSTKGIFTTQTLNVSATAGAESINSAVADAGATLTDKGGNINLGSVVAGDGTVTITDTLGNLNFVGSGTTIASGDLGLIVTAKHIEDAATGAGALTLEAGEGNVTLNAIIGATSVAGLGHDLVLQGDTINVNNNIRAKSVTIDGQHLAYTGPNSTFSVSGTAGDVTLDASIGSVGHAARYNVALKDTHHDIDIERSIFVGNTVSGFAANITATQVFGSSVSGLHGVHVGDADGEAITLSANGSVTLTGANVLVGQDSATTDQGPIDISARTISLTANGIANNGILRVQAGSATGSHSTLDRSISLHATGNLFLTGKNVQILAGVASANLNISAGYATDLANVNVSAGASVIIKGATSTGGSVEVRGGRVGAEVSNLVAGSHSMDMEANVNITAGRAIDVTAQTVTVSAGYASNFTANASHASDNLRVAASAHAHISAGTNVTITGGAATGVVKLSGGFNVGSDVNIVANAVNAKASVAIDAGVSITAGGAIALSGHDVDISAGYGAGYIQGIPHNNIKAHGEGAVASSEITVNTVLTAGIGGITITGQGHSASVNIQGGYHAGELQNLLASSGGNALSSVQARTDLTTTGNITITATGGQVGLSGGSSGDSRTQAVAHTGVAVAKADSGVGLKARAITITAASLGMSGGGYGGWQARTSASGSDASASVSAKASLSLTTTGGAISLRGLHAIHLAAGYGLAGGYVEGGTSSSTHQTGTPSNFQKVTTHYNHRLDGVKAVAIGSGAKATVNASADVNLSATGAISVSQTSYGGTVFITGGAKAGFGAVPTAGQGGEAKVAVQDGVSITAGGAVTLKGSNVRIFAGESGGRGAGESSTVTRTLQNCTESGCALPIPDGSSQNNHAARAQGHGAVSLFDTDASVNVKGSSVIIAATSVADLYAGLEVGSDARLSAAGGGSVSENHKSQVNISATGAFTVTGGDEVELWGMFGAGDGASARAVGGSANLSADTSINITAATMSITAGGSIEISGGVSAGYGAVAHAQNGGVAAVTANAAISITTRNAFSATLTGSSNEGQIGLFAGREATMDATVTGSSAQATVTGQADVKITVTGTTGTIALSTGKHRNGDLSIEAGSSGAESAHVLGGSAHGTATLTDSADVDLGALGAVSLHAGGDMYVAAGEDQLEDAHFTAQAGGKAKDTSSASINISGGAVLLTAGGSASFLGGGYDNGSGVQLINHTSGSVSAIGNTNVSIAATGALTVTAGRDITVSAGGEYFGSRAIVSASSGARNAKANLDLESNITLKGNTAVVLNALRDLSVVVNDSSAAFGAHVSAGTHDTANLTVDENVNIITKGALTALGDGGDVFFRGGDVGYGAVAQASGAGAKATFAASGTVTASAASVVVSASKLLWIQGGNAGNNFSSGAPNLIASHGGSANLKTAAGVTFTAITAFTGRVTGAGSNGIMIEGGNGGVSANILAKNNSRANLSADAGVSVNVTGKGGTLTLTMAKATGSVGVFGGYDDGASLQGSASNGGAIVATTTSTVKLTAQGAITLSAPKGVIDVVAGASAASFATLTGNLAAHVAFTANTDVDITGGTLILTGTEVGVFGGINGIFSGARSLKATAENGASVDAAVSGDANLQALTGAITMNATDQVVMVAAEERAGESLEVVAQGPNSKATGTVANNVNLTAATNVSIIGKNEAFLIGGGGNSIGAGASASASHGGKATVAVSAKVAVTAGGVFIDEAKEVVLVGGSGGVGTSASVKAKHATATLTEDAGLSVTAKSIVAFGSELEVGADQVGSRGVASAHTGGVATLNLKGGLSLTATGGNIALTGKKLVAIFGAGEVGAGSSHTFHSVSSGGGSVSGHHLRTLTSGTVLNPTVAGAHGPGAVATFNADGSVNLTATGAITVSATSAGGTGVYVAAGNSAGARAQVFASAGVASINAKAGVNLAAGGAVSISGAFVTIKGGNDAARGGGRASHNSTVSNCTLGNASCNLVSRSSVSSGGRPDQANGLMAHALINASAGVSISGTAVTLTATHDMLLAAGGNSGGGHASIVAVNSGSAAVTAQTGLKITTPGAFTATAGHNLLITANASSDGGDLGRGAFITAVGSGGSAHATLTASNDVVINAKSVALKATTGSLSIIGGESVGSNLDVHASSGDEAAANLSGTVQITAASTVSLTGKNVLMSAGRSVGRSVRAFASHSSAAASFANVSVTADASVSLTAGGALTIRATDGVGIFAGAFAASSAQISGSGNGANVRLDAKSNVNIAAASVTAMGGTDVFIEGGFLAGAGASVSARDGARTELDIEAGVDISATGAISITSTKGDVDISAGYGEFVLAGARASASNGGFATLNEQENDTITAGTTLTVTAGQNVRIAGAHSLFASGNGFSGSTTSGSPTGRPGTTNVDVSGVTALNAGTNLNVTAVGGSLQVLGGSENGLAINLFPSTGLQPNQSSIVQGPQGGQVTAQLAAGVSLVGGSDVNLKAGKDLTVAAGAGATLAVGMTRVRIAFATGGSTLAYLGRAWGGGSANLAVDVSANVSAGRNLTLTAGAGGAGDLQVQGLRPNPGDFSEIFGSLGTTSNYYNVAAVRGGSADANAVVSLVGNATLNAGNDITLNAKGNASIVGGSLNTLRADHTRGNVTITGSADATLHAGLDVVLNNITGSLTVAGINVNASHSGQVFVDAFGSTGHAVVTGHADALISAGNNVRTVAAIGKNFNVVGGNFVTVVALGSSGTIVNQATGTANANVVAGANVTVTAKGDLNVLGGQNGLVSAGAKGQSGSNSHGSPSSGHHFGIRVATLSATAGIAAKGAVAINAAGSGVVAGGDGLKAFTSFDFSNPSGGSPAILGGFGSAQANGDVSASITAGTTLGLTLGKSLLVRGGASGAATAEAFFVFESRTQANANATASLVSGTDMTITTTHGDVSFAAGTLATAKTLMIEGFSASAQATNHADINVQTGGNLTLNVGRNLVVAGGPETELGSFGASSSFASGAIAVGAGATARTAVTAHATLNVGGALTATLHGGDVFVAAGDSAGALRQVLTEGGTSDNASLTADSGITIHAGGALKVSGAGAVTIHGGLLPIFSSGTASGGPALGASGSAGPATVNVVSSVKISGKGVNINGGKNVTIVRDSSSLGAHLPSFFSSGGVKMDGTVSVISTAGAPVLSLSPLSVRAPELMDDAVRLAPMTSTTGFGGAQPLSLMPTTEAAPASLWTVPVSSTPGSVQTTSQTVSLDILQSQALVVSLVTVAASAPADAPLAVTPHATAFSSCELAAMLTKPFPATCGALWLDAGACQGGR